MTKQGSQDRVLGRNIVRSYASQPWKRVLILLRSLE